MSTILLQMVWPSLSANLGCMSETCCTRLARNAGAKKSPEIRHLGTIAQLCQARPYIFATKAYIDNRKNLLNSNVSPTCPHNMVIELRATSGLLVGEFEAPQQISTGFASWQRYCTALYSNGRQPNFAALNRGRQLYSAGRPSGWTLTHISSSFANSL